MGSVSKYQSKAEQDKRRLTRWMLHVGASITETARSFASSANSFKAAPSISVGSHVAPIAVEHWSYSAVPEIF